jgi:Domain of Unknown Function (DUF1080)
VVKGLFPVPSGASVSLESALELRYISVYTTQTSNRTLGAALKGALMHPRKLSVSLVISLMMIVSVQVLAGTLFEDFSGMPVGACQPDGTSIGQWRFVYNGYGCSGFASSNGNTMLFVRPAVSMAPDETHGSLVLGPTFSGDFTLQVFTATIRQLRTGSAPNPWEVGWVLWHYTDDTHFYYFAAKPNGWELGKEDPAYPGAQRFLATGSSPSFPVGAWYKLGVTQVGNTIQLFANDSLIASVTDRERPYSSGRLGLYSEDAEVYFDNVTLTTGSKGKKKK